MRIDDATVNALLTGKSSKRDNTRVRCYHDEFTDEYVSAQVFLHGHEIAHYYLSDEGDWHITAMDAGWRTRTTKTRLNAMLDGVAKGDRLRIDGPVSNINTKEGTKLRWKYRMGASEYSWMGEHDFHAISPTTK
ncbi:MAG: hypothetical protein DRH08_00605 [Deltaproteobacteria bacterium]|nr:MAG: hypothetical protein DRH08_00605 [Deltaproteobacteria bacterium]